MIGMPDYMNGVWYISLLTIGAAYLAGRGGVFFVVGGYVCYWFLAPIMAAQWPASRRPDPHRDGDVHAWLSAFGSLQATGYRHAHRWGA